MQKKSGLFTFVFACLPGAGQMYLGYMHRGLSLMLIFWGIIFIAAFFSFAILCILLPVVWAYAFFDTFNLRQQTPEQAAAHPDDFLIAPEAIFGRDWRALIAKRHTLFGGLLIFIGIYTLYNTLLRRTLWELYRMLHLSWLGELLDNMPTLVVAVLIIALGVRLVRGGKPAEEDYVSFKGEAGKNE